MTGNRRPPRTGFLPGILHPFRWLVSHGLKPVDAVWTAVIGLLIGIFPALGATSFLCALVAQRLRLNHLLIQGMNYLFFPLQLILLVPFVRLGERIFRPERPMDLTLDEILAMLRDEPARLLDTFLDATLRAVGAWSLTVLPILGVVLFLASRRHKSSHP